MQKGSENMNRIFKVIWSKTKNCYVVASELAKGRTKAASTGDKAKRLALAAITALMLLPVGGYSYAADTTTTVEPAGTGSATAVEVYTQKGADTTFVKKGSDNGQSLTIGVSDSEILSTHQYVTGAQTTYDGQNGQVVTQATGGKSSISLKVGNSEDLTYNFTNYSEVTTTKDGGTTFTYHYEGGAQTIDDKTTIKGNTVTTGRVTASNGVVDRTTTEGVSVKTTNTVGQNLSALDQAMKDEKTSTALHISSSGDLIVGTKENQTVKDMEIRGKLTSGSISTGGITSTGDVTVAGKMAADGVTDETTKDGTYIKQNNTVGKNLGSLDTQVKANADAINEEARKRKYSVTNLEKADAAEAATREAKDNELNERITNEANEIHKTTNKLQSDLNTETDAREAADTALDTRITNVKEYLEKQTSDTYVSKDDAAVQDGAIVKADKTIGENVTNLDAALAKETAARLGADKAQDKVIETVNQNMVDGFNTINKNMSDGFTALNQADAKEAQERAAADASLYDKITAETSARVAADTKLVEAVNSGVSLSDDNVLQKNTTTIDAQGNVTTSKTDANEMILNKGKDNQITLNEKGIKVGTNSSVMDKDGVYTGGDTYTAAKAAMSADGKIKGANGAFTVDENGNVASKATITGETVTDGKGASMSNGTVTGKTLTDGIATITNGNINTSGTITGGTVTSTGNISAVGDIHAGGAITGASASIQGALTAGSATITGDLTAGGAIQGKSISDGTATMQNGNLTGVKNLSAETITTSGDATIGGDLTVKGKLNVDEIDLTKSGIVGDNNVTASTKVAAGEITSYKKATSTKDGSEKESAIDYDENGTSTWAKSTDADGNWKKSTLTVEGSDVTSKVVDSDKNSNESKQTSTESSDVVKDADGNTSTFSQRVKDILQEIKNASGDTLTKVEQTDTAITSQIGDGSAVKSVMDANGIANTATGGTISNSAADVINTGTNSVINQVGDNQVAVKTDSVKAAYGSDTSTTWDAKGITNTTSGDISNSAANISNTTTGNMTNTVGGNLIDTIMGTSTTTVTGKVTEDYKSDLSTKVGGDETHYVAGSQTNTVSGDRTVSVKGTERENFNAQVTNVKTDQRTSVGGNQTNIVAGNQQNTVSGSKTETVKGSVTEKYGSQATTVDGDQSTNIGGNQTTVVAKDQTNTVSGNKTETVKGAVNETYGSQTTKVNGNQSTTVTGKQTNSITGDQVNTIGGSQTTTVTGDVTEDYKANLSTTVGGNQTTTVTGDSSLTAENITNTAKNKITNKAIDVETDATSSIVQKIANDYGSNTSTQLSYQTKEEMSQADGKTASYLRGAAEEKSQLIDGSKKTTIDTIAGQTNTNITDGTNTSNDLQKADQVASSVTDGTNTTVVNQDAKSLASSITDGTKANNTNNTVDKSEQLIKASDTQYSATSKTATKMEDALVSGGSVIDVIKNLDDAANPFIGSAVTDGTNSTGVTQTAKDITNTAQNGTIANEAKDITNNATENMTNTVGKDLTTTVSGEMKTTVTGKTTENYNGGLETTITGEEKHTVNGSQTTTVTGDSSLSAKNITNTATEKLSNSATDIENKASTSILNQVGDNTSWKMTDGQVVESIKGADGQTNTTTTTADDTYQSVQNGNNVLAKRTSSTNDNLNITDGTNTYSKITTATSNKQTVTDGTETASTNLTKSASNTYIINGTQTVTNHIAADTTNTVMNEGSNGSRQEQTASQILNRVTDGTNTNSTTTTASGTTFENTAHNTALPEMTKHESGDFTKTTISGNTIETGQATMDYAEVMKDLGVHGNATVDQKLTVKGDSDLQGNANVGKNLTVNGTSDLKGNVTMESNATVQKDLTVNGTTTTDTLHVTSTSTFDGKATFKDIVTMEKDLSVGGNATVAGSMTASSYKVGDKTYIDSNGINANDQKVVNVAPGRIAVDSKDAINGSQLYQTNERVTSVENRVGTVENRVDKLDSRVDKVGANAAALANLHPLEFDADSKWNIAAAVGGYKGETATAIGAFYRPNENVMVNVSSSFGTGENMYGGGISLRIGQGGNKARRNATNGLTEREKAMQKQIDSLTSRLDALLSVINPNMSKDFPDVPENHWAYEAVSRLAGNGVIQGYEDGKYHGDRTMTRYEMAEIIYNALSKGAKAEKKLVEEFKPELQAMAAQKKA